MENTSTFYRSSSNKVVAGVCGGLAEKLVIDPVIIRLVFVLLAVFAGGGILAYIILWIVLPERPWTDAYTSQKSRETSSENPGENQSWQAQDIPNKENPIPDPNASKTQLIAGTILIALGGLFLIAAFIPRINVYDLWPVALIVIGLFILRPTTKF
jgi:phage shock protein C